MLPSDQAAAIKALETLRAVLLSSTAPSDQPAPASKSQPAAAPVVHAASANRHPTGITLLPDGAPVEARPAAPATGPPDLTRLPEFAIVGRELAAVILGISLETLKRLENSGRGPRKIKVSQKRVGYRLSDLRLWVESRTAA
jgi:predicted DNA-binding transcriptional regulator AlpA